MPDPLIHYDGGVYIYLCAMVSTPPWPPSLQGCGLSVHPCVMGLDAQEVGRSVSSYEGSTGIKESGRSWDLQQSSLRSVVEMAL